MLFKGFIIEDTFTTFLIQAKVLIIVEITYFV